VRLLRALAVAAVLVVLGARPAAAVYQCGDQKDDCQCAMSDPYPCCDNGGNCTWWAWEAACCNWAVGLPGWGNANQWAGNARANGNYEVLAAPVVGSIACRLSGTYGHVAWVTAVNGGGIDVTEENCCGTCNYGMRAYSYADWHHFDGGFIVRKGQCECNAGDTQTQGCGRCGTQSRGCGGDCQWGGWSGCGGEGPCSPGDDDTQACGACGGQQSRSCGGDCQWGDFGACSGVCPADAGPIVDAAAAGADAAVTDARVTVVDGWGSPGDGLAGPPPDGQDAAAAPGLNRELAGGCGCWTEPGRPSALLALLGLALLLGRRPRKTS
jgi:MYXO-CTERM domain-containing protein